MAQDEPVITEAPGIRGPELHQPEAIASAIAGQSLEALRLYAAGLLAVLRVWQLIEAARRLEMLRAERTFLLSQLATLEARDLRAVSRALARQAQEPLAAPPQRERDELGVLCDELSAAIGASSSEGSSNGLSELDN